MQGSSTKDLPRIGLWDALPAVTCLSAGIPVAKVQEKAAPEPPRASAQSDMGLKT